MKRKQNYYYFLLDDGDEQIYYYGDIFTNRLVDDRSQYFKLPFNHRADIARVPKWVENAVVYNIFPDSFATGHKNITNEPTKLKYMDQDVHGIRKTPGDEKSHRQGRY